MKLSIHTLIQMGGILAQVLIQIAPVFPPSQQHALAVALAVVQASVGVAAQFSNPDGSSARVAWKPANLSTSPTGDQKGTTE